MAWLGVLALVCLACETAAEKQRELIILAPADPNSTLHHQRLKAAEAEATAPKTAAAATPSPTSPPSTTLSTTPSTTTPTPEEEQSEEEKAEVKSAEERKRDLLVTGVMGGGFIFTVITLTFFTFFALPPILRKHAERAEQVAAPPAPALTT